MTALRALRRIVIAGGGSAGWMAAASLANVLGGACAVELVESDEIGTVGVGEATIPPIKMFLQGLGLDEVAVLRATGATAKLGIEFDGWAREGARYFHPFGTYGIPFDQVPFHHWWLRERAAGGAGPLDAYSMAAVMAARGRFAHPASEPRMVQSTFDYAYHLDAGLFARMLRTYAEARGVVRTEGRIAAVEREGEREAVAALRLEDGRRIAGDFFIDCTGFASLLVGGAMSVAFEDWSGWLPCDRAWAVPSALAGPAPPFTRSTAREAGWQWRIPLRHRVGNGLVFCSDHQTEEAAREALLASVPDPLAEPRLLRFTTGRRRSFWRGNCLALGLAAGFMEPLESTSLHLVQTGIARFLALFPDRDADPLAAAEYDRLTGEEYQRTRDFLILHYHANARGGELWRRCREMTLPDALAYRTEQFRAGGRLVSPGPELFQNASWLAVLIGQGVTPARWAPLADHRPMVPAADRLRTLRRAIADAAQAMTPHDAWLGRAAGT